MAGKDVPSDAANRVTFAAGVIGKDDIVRIMAETRYATQTDAICWALRFASRFLERQAEAKARGRDGHLEWVETTAGDPDDIRRIVELDML